MPRLPRLKTMKRETWYLLANWAAGSRKFRPFATRAIQRRFLNLLEKYTKVYSCEVASYSLAGNCFYLVVRFDAFRRLSRKELRRRAALLYKRKTDWPRSPGEWRRFNRRLFDVSEFMRNLNQTLARRYNLAYDRQGAFWSARFRSTILSGLQAVLNAMIYAELEPLRQGCALRPELWVPSSLYQRLTGKGGIPLINLRAILRNTGRPLREYLARLYFRGGMNLPDSHFVRMVEKSEMEWGFTGGDYLSEKRQFVNGKVLGPLQDLVKWAVFLWKSGITKRPAALECEGTGKLYWLGRRRRAPLVESAVPCFPLSGFV